MNQNIETIQNKWGFGINELKEVLDTDINDFIYEDKDNEEISFKDNEGNKRIYLLMSDEEADEYAKERILDSVWAFTSTFLTEHMPLENSILRRFKNFMKMQTLYFCNLFVIRNTSFNMLFIKMEEVILSVRMTTKKFKSMNASFIVSSKAGWRVN
jgi:hypothetical protein